MQLRRMAWFVVNAVFMTFQIKQKETKHFFLPALLKTLKFWYSNIGYKYCKVHFGMNLFLSYLPRKIHSPESGF